MPQSGFPVDPVVRGFGLHAGIPRSHEGPHPELVQHGGLRQPGEGGGAPGQEGRGMEKGGHGTRQQSVALRASVGSTEASNGRLARFGVVGPKRATRLAVRS
jgi:hypothetical protein